jgi:hypothetical protein
VKCMTILWGSLYCSVILLPVHACGRRENANSVGAAPPEAELKQGTIRVSGSDEGHYRVRRDDVLIGTTPDAFSQRVGTARVYSVLDEHGRVLCMDTVQVRSPYETIELVCNPKTGRFGAPAPRP